jgi:soluble lytic murein transglycosylase
VLETKRFSLRLLTTPETNIRIGTAYLAELMNRFRDAHLALASYNAGEYRVAAWQAERPGLERDEWIDDIPFPETQNYVKRVLGTAEDYRRLYSDAAATAPVKPAAAPKTPAVQKARKK